MIPKERLPIIFKNSGCVWAPYYPLQRILWYYKLQKFVVNNLYSVISTENISKTISIPFRFVRLSVYQNLEQIPPEFEWKLYPENPYNENLAYLISKDGLYWEYSDRWNPDCELFETRDECFEYCVKKNSNSRFYHHPSFDLFPSKMLLLIHRYRLIINTIGHAYGIKTTTS